MVYRKPLGEPAPQASNLALAVVLLIVVVVQAVFNAWQDFSTSRVMASIKGMLPSAVAVLRDGKQVTVPAIDLVTGDLVFVGMGQKVPADLRLMECSGDLKFDRSILTGEVRSLKWPMICANVLHCQSEPVAGRVDKTDDNFLEVCHRVLLKRSKAESPFRPRMSRCKVPTASVDLEWVSSSRPGTSPSC